MCGTWAIATSSEVEKIAIYMITRAGKTEGNSVQIKLACEEDQLYPEEYMGGCDETYELCPKWVTRSDVHMYLHEIRLYFFPIRQPNNPIINMRQSQVTLLTT